MDSPTTSPVIDAPRSLVPSLFGVIGGALATIGFFLPWYANADKTLSGWDFAKVYLTGTVDFSDGPVTHVPISLSIAFVYAIPLLVSLVALASGIMGFWVKNSALICGLFGAASILGLVNYQVSGGIVRYSLSTNYPSATGLGLALLNIGFFCMVVASIVSLAHYLKRP